MPIWQELTEGDRLTAVQMRAGGDSFADIAQHFGIINVDGMARKVRGRLHTMKSHGADLAMPVAPTPGEILQQGAMDAFMAWQTAINRLRAASVVDELDYRIEDDLPVGLAFVADRHIGSLHTDHVTMLAHVELLAATPGMYVMEGGDAVDNMALPMKLSAETRGDMPPDMQYTVYRDILIRLGPRLVCVAHGNHDQWTQRYGGVDVLADIAARVNTVCTEESATIRVDVAGAVYTIVRQHKPRFQSYMNPAHAVIRLWETCDQDFDIGCLDHQHVPYAEEFVKHGRARIAIRSGTYKIFDAWSKARGYYGARIGVPVVYLWPKERRMELARTKLDLEQACNYLTMLRGGG